MTLDGMWRRVELFADFHIRESLPDEPHDVAFAAGHAEQILQPAFSTFDGVLDNSGKE